MALGLVADHDLGGRAGDAVTFQVLDDGAAEVVHQFSRHPRARAGRSPRLAEVLDRLPVAVEHVRDDLASCGERVSLGYLGA
jgi:hypothetical protein